MFGEGTISAADLTSRIDKVRRDFRDSELQIGDCLAQQGFVYVPSQLKIDVLSSTGGLFTVSERQRRFGYGIVNNEGSGGVIVTIRSAELPLDQQQVLDSLMTTKCMGLGLPYDAQEVLSERTPTSEIDETRLLKSREFSEAQAQWRKCMADAGYSYGSGKDAFADLNRQYESVVKDDSEAVERFRKMEIAVATRDIDCNLKHIQPVVKRILGEG